MTGNPNGGSVLVPGWNDPDASINVTEYEYSKVHQGKTHTVKAYRVTVDVPYVPIVGVIVPALEFLMKTSFKNDKYMIKLTHMQAMIGD